MIDKDDENWLNALAGKPDSKSKKSTNGEADLLRHAMIKRRENLENKEKEYDVIQFKRLHDRIASEGLIFKDESAESERPKISIFDWIANIFPSKKGGVAALPAWSLAVNFCLAVVVAFQFSYSSPDSYESDVLRSDKETVLRVDSPQLKLFELVSILDGLGARYVVSRKSDSEIVIIIQASELIEVTLSEKRIYPNVINSLIWIKIVKS